MCFSHTVFVYIDICKQKCTFAGVDIYYLARKHWITAIPQNWAYHGIERPQPYLSYIAIVQYEASPSRVHLIYIVFLLLLNLSCIFLQNK